MIIKSRVELQETGDDVEVNASYDDETVDVPDYWITSFGVDYDVDGIVRRLRNGDIDFPGFQRGYVWGIKRASRFIESLLLRLPVPGIFLYRHPASQIQKVIDGQQRLETLRRFYDGKFDNKLFALSGVNPAFEGLLYSDLTHEDRRKLDDSIVHATVIRQDKPDDGGSSQFAIFERLNTNATPLSAQEIRAAIYHGPFNDLLTELNDNPDWRALFGIKHRRRRDEELILRFFALFHYVEHYHRPMKAFLNSFMNLNRDLDKYSRDELQNPFADTLRIVLSKIGPRAFKLKSAVNAALYDAVMVGVARRLESGNTPTCIREEYDDLLADKDFVESLDVRTSGKESVVTRLQRATKAFAQAE